MTKTAITAILLCTSAFASDAVMFRGNPEHTGVYNSAAIATLGGVKWKFKTGGQVISSPTVSDGTVYVGSADHNLYAIDAVSGAQKWKFKTASRVSSATE